VRFRKVAGLARRVLCFSSMDTRTTSTDRQRCRSIAVIMGPPGLFIGLTLAALIAAIYISQSTTAGATPRPAPAATAKR
jgi:hypothetical protein